VIWPRQALSEHFICVLGQYPVVSAPAKQGQSLNKPPVQRPEEFSLLMSVPWQWDQEQRR